MGDPYFATLKNAEFLPRFFERVDRYYQHLEGRGWLNLYRASHAASYSGFYVGGRMNQTGQNGKFTALEANEYRNLATHILNMIVSQKMQPEAQARNMDHQSQQQAVVANGLAETLTEEKELEWLRQEVNEKGLYYGESWVIPVWNKDLGEVYATDVTEQGQEVPLHAGDLEYRVRHPIDVVRDVTRPTSQGHCWYADRSYVNRYDLMALYPQFAEEIEGLPSAVEAGEAAKRPRLYVGEDAFQGDHCDEVAVWTFMHEKTPAVPDGRIVVALSEDLAIEDDVLPYRELPHIRWSAADVDGTPFGYSLFFDLLALQQGINAGVSAVATRMAAFALPTLAGGDQTQLKALGDGLSVLTYSEGQPEPKVLDFANIPEGLVSFIKMLRELAATYSGINNVARGQPEGGITAASALALLESRAIQFVALSQKADIQVGKSLFTKSLHHIQDHAQAPFVVRMAGQSNRSRVTSFLKTAKDVQAVEGFTMKLGSALQSTTAGRMQLIEGAKASGVTFTTEQYWQVMNTGRLDPVTRGPQKEQEQIEAENEALTNGEDPPVVITDHHPLHIQEHCVVLADPESRKDAGLQQRVLAHIQEHEQQWLAATAERPQLLAAKGIPPAPMPIPPPPDPSMTQPGAPGAPGGTPPPAKGKGSVSGPLAETMPGGPPVKTEHAMPARNPVTGQPNPVPQVTA